MTVHFYSFVFFSPCGLEKIVCKTRKKYTILHTDMSDICLVGFFNTLCAYHEKSYLSVFQRPSIKIKSYSSYTKRYYICFRFIIELLGVRTRRRRRKSLTASCSLLLFRDWRVSLRTSSRSSPTLELGMGREAQRSEQEHYSPVSITRTQNVVKRELFIIYMNKLNRERFVQTKQKCLNNPIYRKNNPRLTRVRLDHNSTIIANGKHFLSSDI